MNRIALDDEAKWQAFLARDARFDGQFYAAVRTTGVFCRSICPGRPKRENVMFFPNREASIAAGFRACKRCKP
jgi:methylphosphotriester-DNA--protein-cysteine methyltransferase